jgi:hypothetical protein
MRHARHDTALNAAEKALEIETTARGQKFIVIIYDGPIVTNREASYISNVNKSDVVAITRAVADQITRNGAN